MLKKIPVEICVAADEAEGAVTSAQAAFEGRADRIELCARMDLEGLTPSAEILRRVRCAVDRRLEIAAMSRPVAGDFEYSALQAEQMCAAIEQAAEAGAESVVLGAIRNGRPDFPVLKQLIGSAHRLGRAVTFHRAFDALTHPRDALAALIDLGVRRVLTAGTPWGSGQTALKGVDRLKNYLEWADGKIEVVIGGGIAPENAAELLKQLTPGEARMSLHAYRSVLKEGVTDCGRVSELVEAVKRAGG